MEHPIAPGSVAPRVAGMHLAWGDHHHGAGAQRDYLLAETERAAAFVHDPDRKGRMRVRAVAPVGAGGLPAFDRDRGSRQKTTWRPGDEGDCRDFERI